MKTEDFLAFSDEVKQAFNEGKPVVALESTVIAHGLPLPVNIETAISMEKVIREKGAVPATIGIVKGKVKIGMSEEEIEWFARSKPRKVGMREIPTALALRENGATTVSGTLLCASKVGIEVFATGGIGGVHRDVVNTFDISQDLLALTKFNMIVVSSGMKSILDVGKTCELLETLGIVAVGYRTDRMPLFYSSESDITIRRVSSVGDIIRIFDMVKRFYFGSVLVMNPVPKKDEIRREEMESWLRMAEDEMRRSKVSGKNVTPFLLSRIATFSRGRTIRTNTSLLIHNAELASEIAISLKNR
ncbi:MAG: pseudouridine-5-phosphate glycosidase [Thermotoga sp.]|nr:MAG: pseudouridine-5-phosphate glycosidase [Thermotoga sp.]